MIDIHHCYQYCMLIWTLMLTLAFKYIKGGIHLLDILKLAGKLHLICIYKFLSSKIMFV